MTNSNVIPAPTSFLDRVLAWLVPSSNLSLVDVAAMEAHRNIWLDRRAIPLAKMPFHYSY